MKIENSLCNQSYRGKTRIGYGIVVCVCVFVRSNQATAILACRAWPTALPSSPRRTDMAPTAPICLSARTKSESCNGSAGRSTKKAGTAINKHTQTHRHTPKHRRTIPPRSPLPLSEPNAKEEPTCNCLFDCRACPRCATTASQRSEHRSCVSRSVSTPN